jgi:hypothetical protein
MNFISYKLIKLYSINYITYKKNMTKTIKLVSNIILFTFLFLNAKAADNNSKFIPIATSIKCNSDKDCPDIFVAYFSSYAVYIAMCWKGFCQRVVMKPK